MELFKSRRRQKQREKEVFNPENEGKGQFNIVIDKEIRNKVQELATRLRINQSALSEHLLQVALFYTNIAIKDEEKQNILEKHLINAHLLDKNVGNEETIIRIGEASDNWLLLKHSEQVIARVRQATQALGMAMRTGNRHLLAKAERELMDEVLKFTEWIINKSSENS